MIYTRIHAHAMTGVSLRARWVWGGVHGRKIIFLKITENSTRKKEMKRFPQNWECANGSAPPSRSPANALPDDTAPDQASLLCFWALGTPKGPGELKNVRRNPFSKKGSGRTHPPSGGTDFERKPAPDAPSSLVICICGGRGGRMGAWRVTLLKKKPKPSGRAPGSPSGPVYARKPGETDHPSNAQSGNTKQCIVFKNIKTNNSRKKFWKKTRRTEKA